MPTQESGKFQKNHIDFASPEILHTLQLKAATRNGTSVEQAKQPMKGKTYLQTFEI